MPTIYYACLELKPEAYGKNSKNKIIKKMFWGEGARKAARAYIREHYDQNIHTSCWTE